MGLSLLYGPLGTWDDLTPGNATLTPTPEPASLLLLATGVLGIGLHARRKRGDRT